jgi:hypothetical protein
MTLPAEVELWGLAQVLASGTHRLFDDVLGDETGHHRRDADVEDCLIREYLARLTDPFDGFSPRYRHY